MNINTFTRRVERILSQDPDLAMQYTLATNESIEDLIGDMYQLIQKNQVTDSCVDMVLVNAIRIAISSETSVLDILSMKERVKNEMTGPIGRYFEDVGRVYERNNNDMNIVYCPENRQKLIEMNTKTVIYIAKKYQNKGVDFDDLIGAGNLGLCIAFDKFKPKNKLFYRLQEYIDEFEGGEEDKVIDGMDAVASLSRAITYGSLNANLVKSFKKDKKYSKKDLRNWIERNITDARFNSVASMWIRACILQEIKNSTLIHLIPYERNRSKKQACTIQMYMCRCLGLSTANPTPPWRISSTVPMIPKKSLTRKTR